MYSEIYSRYHVRRLFTHKETNACNSSALSIRLVQSSKSKETQLADKRNRVEDRQPSQSVDVEGHAVSLGRVVEEQAERDVSAHHGRHDVLKGGALPVRAQGHGPEDDEESGEEAARDVSHGEGQGAASASSIALDVSEVLDLDGGEGVEAEQGAPLVAGAGHVVGVGGDAGGAELAGRVEESIDNVLAPPGASADVVVDPGLGHEGQGLGETAEGDASDKEEDGGDDVPLLGVLDAETAGGDSAPGLVDLIFFDGLRVLLVAEVEVEDVEPDVEQGPRERRRDVSPAGGLDGDAPGRQAQHGEEDDGQDIGLDVALGDEVGERQGVLDLGDGRRRQPRDGGRRAKGLDSHDALREGER